MKIILNLLLILVIISTVSICLTKPDLHKTVLVYDSAYIVMPQEEIKTETESIPLMEKPQKPVETTIRVEQNFVKKEDSSKKFSTQTVKKSNVQKQNIGKRAENIVTKQPVKLKEQKTQTQSIKKETYTPAQQKQVEIKTETKVEPIQKILTEKEETIAWNIWRSNLQNKIMEDTKLPILPQGVVFRFSFTVDKYGKITNLQTWSDSSTYTPYAIQYIAPVIRSYQGRSILSFPSGTARITTNVKGGWRISENEKYSTPKDYNDLEKIQR